MDCLSFPLNLSDLQTKLNPLFQTILASPAVQNAKPSSTADGVVVLLFLLSALGYLTHGRVWDKPDPHHGVWFERPQLADGASNGRVAATRDISQKLAEDNYHCVIFWGSQSGTSERFAETLGRECLSHFGINALVADLSDYDADSISKIEVTHFAIFVLSTYGEGDPSDNTCGLWDWIKQVKDKKLEVESLRYLAFGLGNSNYKYYNRVLDVVADALDSAGANALMSRQKADDANGDTEEDFQAWKDELFALFRKLGYEQKTVEYRPTIELTFSGETHSEEASPATSLVHQQTSTQSAIVPLTIKSAHELFATGGRNCIHMELDLGNQDIVYKTGDHIGIWPCNPEEEIEKLLNALGAQSRRHETFSVKSDNDSVKARVPSPTTLDDAFRHHLEICAPVARKTVQEVAQFSPTPAAKATLLEIGQNRERYEQLTSSMHITLARLLQLASPTEPWTALPLAFIIENLLSLQPRYYSISSSSVIAPRRIAVTALVVNKTIGDNSSTSTIHGLTSNYLLSASDVASNATVPTPSYRRMSEGQGLSGSKVLAHVRKSKFKLPITSSTPLILISAGTGFAPFRAFLQERAKLYAIGKPVGNILLFFGCRNKDDFIYREELNKIKNDLGGKLKIITAFSREGAKTYVQDRVGEHTSKILELLDAGANMYICGKASMAREVDMRMEDAVSKAKSLGETEVKAWTDSLKKRGKWKADVWG
jgi:NADPH-ferrihemoprotein reductase